MSPRGTETVTPYVIRRRAPRAKRAAPATVAEARLLYRERAAAARLTADDVSRNRLAQLARDADVAYVITDAYGKIVQANEAASRLLGSNAQPLLGKRLRNYLVRASRPDFYVAMARMTDAQSVQELRGVLRPRKGGPLVEAALTALGKRGATGALLGVHWFVRVVTPRAESAAETGDTPPAAP